MTISLMDLMLELRSDPKTLARYFPEIADSLDTEPVNVSRKHRGTPEELRELIVAFGFGDPIKHVVCVAMLLDGETIGKGVIDDIECIRMLYAVEPILLVLSAEKNFTVSVNGGK
jgi:hypothetical protein